jgi:HlyD family secretion protein
MQVHVKTDESDVGSVELGRPVVFKVDAFPKTNFHGVVSQIRMNATVIQNVVTYDTIIDFDNREMKLFPGMTAYATIPIATVENALKVPNAALRYKPPLALEEIRVLYSKFGIEEEAARDEKETPSPGTAAAASRIPGGKAERPDRPTAATATAVVWKLRAGGTLEPMKIAVGITDHSYTELIAVVRGELREGDEILTGSVGGAVPGGVPPPGGLRR